jgi:predicted metal-dependent peptidase
MTSEQLTAEQRVQKAIISIMQNPRYIALAGILMLGERDVIDADQWKYGTPTACTNGRDEWYHREFVSKLNDAELRFLILHESYHKLYRHMITWQHLAKENAELANMAMDYVINIKLVDDNTDEFATMTGELAMGCIDPKYRDWDTALVYHDLVKNPPPQDGNGGGDGKTGIGNPDGETVSQPLTSGQGKPIDSHDWDGAKDMTPTEANELARDIDEAIRQGALVAGKTGSGGDRDLVELLKPQIDWREVLREFVTTTCTGSDYSTWQRPNRRYISAGVYMPSGISESIGELVIAIDTSGSIGQPELSRFLTEVKEICDTVHPDKVRILYWDTQVCGDEKYEMHELDDLVKSTKPKGGGGTMIECVPEYMTKEGVKPQACIVLTDGYLGSSWGKWACPVLWCIIDNESAVPDVGTHVHVKSREL